MNIIELMMIKKNLTRIQLAQEMRNNGIKISNYTLGQRILDLNNFKYNELKFILNKLNIKFEELEKSL